MKAGDAQRLAEVRFSAERIADAVPAEIPEGLPRDEPPATGVAPALGDGIELRDVRAHWPASKPLFVRFSVEDDAGWGPDQSVTLAKILKPKGVDVIDCSSGGMRGSPVVSAGPVTYGYQVPYAERLKRDADIMTMAVGLIVHADQAEQILQDGRADLVALARELLYNPNWPMDAAQKLGVDPTFASVPPPQAYWLAKRAQSVKDVVPSTYGKGLKVS